MDKKIIFIKCLLQKKEFEGNGGYFGLWGH